MAGVGGELKVELKPVMTTNTKLCFGGVGGVRKFIGLNISTTINLSDRHSPHGNRKSAYEKRKFHHLSNTINP